jgi:hypothetical protein
VDFPALLALLEQSPDLKIMMVELDPGSNPPITPLETARISKSICKSRATHSSPIRAEAHRNLRF